MRFDAQKALIAYSGALTAAVVGVLVSGAVQGAGPGRFTEIEVERINVREPDGTLRMTISNQTRFPEIIVRGREYPHTGRDAAGMLFFNEEGSETGGLIWGGRMVDGKRTAMGSLTFDRYEQDQTIQMMGVEDGDDRSSGFRINDQPEKTMDFSALPAIRAMPEDQRGPAYAAANFGTIPRAFLGRQTDGASELVLRDGTGKARLVLSVGADGAAKIDFLDVEGAVTRTVTPADADG